jgi:predicted nucleic acid-binding protein
VAGVILLDANVLIGLLDASDAHHHAAMSIMRVHEAENFCSSALTVTEALIYPTRAGLQREALSALDDLGIFIRPTLIDNPAGTAELRVRYGLLLADAVVLHEAIAADAKLATFDVGLAAAAEQAGVSLVAA